MPRLLNTYALVSRIPTPRIQGESFFDGGAKELLALRITIAANKKLVNRMIQTVGAPPSSGTTRIPSNQNITPKATAAVSAQPTPSRFLAGCVAALIAFASSG